MFIQKKKVMFSDCDMLAKMSVSKALEIVQDVVAASFKVESVDNVTIKEKYNFMWIFSKNKLKMNTEIKWDTLITIRTRPIKTTRIKRYMLTEFLNDREEVLVYSILECCVLDLAEFKIQRLDSIGIEKYEEETDYDLSFIPFESNAYSLKAIRDVTIDLIDFSFHVNNSEYIRLIISTLSKEEYLNANYNTLEVSYLGQARLNDKLSIYLERTANKAEYLIKNQDNIDILKLHFILL